MGRRIFRHILPIFLLNTLEISFGSSIFSVTRHISGQDLFTLNSPLDCALANETCGVDYAVTQANSNCSCKCPETAPIFLQHKQQCTNTSGECERIVEFKYEEPQHRVAPAIFLPPQNHQIDTKPLDWSRAGIEVNRNGSVPCILARITYLKETGWGLLNPKIFTLTTDSNRKAAIIWRGNEEATIFLAGKLIQVSIQCSGGATLCIFLRIAGSDAVESISKNPTSSNSWLSQSRQPETMASENDNQIGLIIGIVCACLLIATLLGVAIFWVVCWRHQKERLIRKIQMQFMYQHRVNHQQQANGMYHTYPPMQESIMTGSVPMDIHSTAVAQGMSPHGSYHDSGDDSDTVIEMDDLYGHHISPTQPMRNGVGPGGQPDWMVAGNGHSPVGCASSFTPSPEEIAAMNGGWAPNGDYYDSNGNLQNPQDNLPPPPPYPHMKKKLYFSPEFFEPENMADPPQVAEEFLYEVRRMIDIAKGRIRSRRYIGAMESITESTEDKHSQGGDSERDYSECQMASNGNIRRNSNSNSQESHESSNSKDETYSKPDGLHEQSDHRLDSGSPASGSAGDSDETNPDSGTGVTNNSDESKDSSSPRSSTAADDDSGVCDTRATASNSTGDPKSDANVQNDTSNGAPQGQSEEKVNHWLSKMPEEPMEIEESPPSSRKPVRHSRLFKDFNARQAMVQKAGGSPPGIESSPILGRASVSKVNGAHKSGLPPQTAGQQRPYGAQYSSNQDYWRSPEYVSRSQILNTHSSGPGQYARPMPAGQAVPAEPIGVQPMSPQPPAGSNAFGSPTTSGTPMNTYGLNVASLPRQFMRQHGALGSPKRATIFPANPHLNGPHQFPIQSARQLATQDFYSGPAPSGPGGCGTLTRQGPHKGLSAAFKSATNGPFSRKKVPLQQPRLVLEKTEEEASEEPAAEPTTVPETLPSQTTLASSQ